MKVAVPKTIMHLMNVEGLTRENVASHLQKYRLQLKKGNNWSVMAGDDQTSSPKEDKEQQPQHAIPSSPLATATTTAAAGMTTTTSVVAAEGNEDHVLQQQQQDHVTNKHAEEESDLCDRRHQEQQQRSSSPLQQDINVEEEPQTSTKTPPQKRKRTIGPDEELVAVQSVIKKCACDNRFAIFHDPIDWKLLGRTDYLEIVKTPKDLTTILRKLERGKYTGIDAVLADVSLIWSNCRLYNPDPSHMLYRASTKCETLFEKLWKKADPGPQDDNNDDDDNDDKVHEVITVEDTEAAPRGKKEASSSQNNKRSRKAKASSPAVAPSPAPAHKSSQSKRPLSKDEPSVEVSLAAAQVVLDYALGEAKYGLFIDPVDWEALGLLDYPNIVTQPMDLRTVKARVDAAVSAGDSSSKKKKKKGATVEAYTCTDEVFHDVLLIWSNCKAYNADGSDIVVTCKSCEKDFTKAWKRAGLSVPKVTAEQPQTTVSLPASGPGPVPQSKKASAGGKPTAADATVEKSIPSTIGSTAELPGPRITAKDLRDDPGRFVGQDVLVYWDGDAVYYSAVVMGVTTAHGEKKKKKKKKKQEKDDAMFVKLKYKVDGEKEDVNVDDDIVCLAPSSGKSAQKQRSRR